VPDGTWIAEHPAKNLVVLQGQVLRPVLRQSLCFLRWPLCLNREAIAPASLPEMAASRQHQQAEMQVALAAPV